MPRKKTIKKKTDRKAQMRERFATPTGGYRRPVDCWFDRHPEAREDVELWLEMKLQGTTDWSTRRLQNDLIERYEFPHPATTTFVTWLARTFGKTYKQAVGRPL